MKTLRGYFLMAKRRQRLRNKIKEKILRIYVWVIHVLMCCSLKQRGRRTYICGLLSTLMVLLSSFKFKTSLLVLNSKWLETVSNLADLFYHLIKPFLQKLKDQLNLPLWKSCLSNHLEPLDFIQSQNLSSIMCFHSNILMEGFGSGITKLWMKLMSCLKIKTRLQKWT